ISYKCHPENDQRAAEEALRLGCGGRDIKQMQKHIAERYSNEGERIYNECKAQIRALLAEHRNQLEAISQALFERKTLSAQDIEAIIHPTATQPVTPQESIPAVV